MKTILSCLALSFCFSAYAAPSGTLSVHILNQQTGLPSPEVKVELDKLTGNNWTTLATEQTDKGGRVSSLYPAKGDMEPGTYRVIFYTGDYFKSQNLATFFPSIPVIFTVEQKNQRLHVPLLLSQYGYSTYRGS